MKTIILTSFLVILVALMLFGCTKLTPKQEVYYETFVKENVGSARDCTELARFDVMDICKKNLSHYLDCNAYWNATEVSYNDINKSCYVSILLKRDVKK